MIKIKFTGTFSISLVKHGSPEEIVVTKNQGGFNDSPWVQFLIEGNKLSETPSDYYQFAILEDVPVSVSGQLGEVTTDYQFFNLFKDCSQITNASELSLSGTSMKFFCYANMFQNCTGLVTPPSTLSASTLAKWCYSGMFAGCINMTSTPTLPATTLAPYCYYAMFYNCKKITDSPNLPAETLVDWCYNSMFYNCQKLTSISAGFYEWNGNATSSWVNGVAQSGMFNNSNVEVIFGKSNIPEGWKIDYSNVPLTFKAKNGKASISLNQEGSPSAITLQYNKNNTGWVNYEIGDIISLEQNEFVRMSGANERFSKNWSNYYHFVMTGQIEAKGNIQALVNYSDNAYYYRSLFANCTGLLTPPELPATPFAGSCYQEMFAGCTSLTSVPILPATTLTELCYLGMFSNCSGLISVPMDLLPATTLVVECYAYMFSGCTSLTSAPNLPATSLASNCYNSMFYGCTNLSSAPELPATTLKQYCYTSMFYGCTNLSSINVAFTDWREGATNNWVYNVAPTGIFTKPRALDEFLGESYIPNNWTVINK